MSSTYWVTALHDVHNGFSRPKYIYGAMCACSFHLPEKLAGRTSALFLSAGFSAFFDSHFVAHATDTYGTTVHYIYLFVNQSCDLRVHILASIYFNLYMHECIYYIHVLYIFIINAVLCKLILCACEALL